ncbi:MAG: DUF3786 domain-containing protein [Actinomycetota bacterium]
MAKNLKNNQEILLQVYDDYFNQLAEKDLNMVSANSGSILAKNSLVEVYFFNQTYIVDIDKKEIKKKQDYKITNPYTSSIILHYLVNADGAPLSGEWISYRQLPDGMFYARTIGGALEPLVKAYGNNLEGFFKKARKLGAKKSENFDCGMVLNCFRKVPLLVIVYPESEEFGAEAKILFDQSISHYLKTDVIKLVILYTVKLLVK